MVSYQTAWLKANHPVEFMAAVMNCDIHLTDKLGPYKQEVDRLGIEVVPPCVNRSGATFGVAEGRILYALGALKNVGVDAMRLIAEARARRRPLRPASSTSPPGSTSAASASARWRCSPAPARSTRSIRTAARSSRASRR